MINEEATFEKYCYVSSDLSKGSHKPVIAICDFCEKEFVIDRRFSGGHTYCSIGCVGKRNRGAGNPSWTGGGVSKICIFCGNVYVVNKARDTTSSFCSVECYRMWRISEENPSRVGREVLKICKYCNTEYMVSKHYVDTSVFCSVECYRKWNVGANHPLWLGGLSFFPYCPKFDENFKEGIRERFYRGCFVCGKSEELSGRKLDVHHVNYLKSCLCEDFECDFVPLCAKCHRRTNYDRYFWERLFTYALGYYDEYYSMDIPKGLLRTDYINSYYV